ncbi:MAG: hypothetical protein ACK4LB_12670 [Spirosomataceae bacterium]
MDFMWQPWLIDSLHDGRRLRVFNASDEYNRESSVIEWGMSYPAERVIRVLSQLEEEGSLPNQIRANNPPRLSSKVFQSYCKKK